MRILGLDIGALQIKAVEVNTAFGQFDIQEYHELSVPVGASPIETAYQLIDSLPKKPDRIVMPLRSNRVTYRNLTLPTRDKKAIQSSVQFELEDDLPFELDDCFYDLSVVSQQGQESKVHVAAILKKTFKEYLESLQTHSIDPDAMTAESSAYRSLLNQYFKKSEIQPEGPVLLLQVGHEHTTLYVYHESQTQLCKEIAWGSREVTYALSSRYQLAFDAAEKTKIESGFILPKSKLGKITQEQYDFSSTCFRACEELFRVIRQTDLSIKNSTGAKISQIFVSGGGALLSGFIGTLSEELKLPVKLLKPLSVLGDSKLSYSDLSESKFSLALGAALTQLNSEKPTALNFRKLEFSKKGSKNSTIDLSEFKKPLLILGTAAMLVLIISQVEIFMLKDKLTKVNAQLEKAAKGFFGSQASSSSIRSYVATPSLLKKNLEAELNKEREIAKLMGFESHSSFEYLKELSSTVPRDLITDLMDYQVGSSSSQQSYLSPEVQSGGQVTLNFTVASPQVAEKLSTLLQSKIKNFSKTPLEEYKASDGSKKWKITYKGSLSESGGTKK